MAKTTQEQLLLQILKKVEGLDMISGGNGTVKLVTGDAWTGSALGVCFSEDSTVSVMTDSNALTITSYFTSATYAVKAGDIFTAQGWKDGARFTNLRVTSGTAMIVL